MSHRGLNAIFALLVCVSALLMLGNLTQGHNWGGDFAAYIMQAKSLTELDPAAFVESNRFTVEQSSYPWGPIAYPWGFPLLLTPLYGLFGLTPIALKSVNVVSWLLLLFVLWFAFRKSHPDSWFLILVSLIALNPTLLSFSNNILSDLPFLLVSTFCISLIQKVVAQDRRLISPAQDQLIIGVVIALAFFIRTNGVILLFMLAFTQFISWLQSQSPNIQLFMTDERWSRVLKKAFGFITASLMTFRLLNLIPYIVFFIFTTISNWTMPEGGVSYILHLKGISIGTVENNLHYYLGLLSDFFLELATHHLFMEQPSLLQSWAVFEDTGLIILQSYTLC